MPAFILFLPGASKDAEAKLSVNRHFPAIGDLEAAGSLALHDDLAVPGTQFDLSAVTAGAVNLLGNLGRAGEKASGFAFGDVAAFVDADGCRGGIVNRAEAYRSTSGDLVGGCWRPRPTVNGECRHWTTIGCTRRLVHGTVRLDLGTGLTHAHRTSKVREIFSPIRCVAK